MFKRSSNSSVKEPPHAQQDDEGEGEVEGVFTYDEHACQVISVA